MSFNDYKRENDNEKINFLLISNITLEPFVKPLIFQKFDTINKEIVFSAINYSEYSGNLQEEKFSKAQIIVVIINFDCLYPDMINQYIHDKFLTQRRILLIYNECERMYRYLRNKTKATIIWFGFEDFFSNAHLTNGYTTVCNNIIDEINSKMISVISKGDVYIDLKRLISEIGIQQSFNCKWKYRWNIPYSKKLIFNICNEMFKQYLIQNGITKKCIILDCDNVLWGGILSEDGVEKVILNSSGKGKYYQDFQRFLLYLYLHGIILTICSKNDLSDIIKMFNEHSCMILKEKHISCFQVNWNNKVDNIFKISEILNIGLDSMVFIDDSYFEIAAVKKMIPEITAIQYNPDTIFTQLSCFNLKNDIDIDKIIDRVNTYKTEQMRNNLKAKYSDFTHYLEELEMNIDIHRSLPIEISRISELSQRTNKCTNGTRYTISELQNILNSSYELYSVFVSDKFSDLGLVGAFGINNTTLDLFTLSCRALGRNIENAIISVLSDYKITNIRFASTGKNEDLRTFLNAKLKSDDIACNN